MNDVPDKGDVKSLMKKRRGAFGPAPQRPIPIPNRISQAVRDRLPEHLKDVVDVPDLVSRLKAIDEERLRTGDLPKREDLTPGAKLTILNQVVYQAPHADAIATDVRYSVNLKSDEQPCVRKLKAGPQYTALAEGSWVKDAGLVVVTNDEPKGTEGKVMELSLCLPLRDGPGNTTTLYPVFSRLPPGTSCQFAPKNLAAVMVLAEGSDLVRYTVSMFPK